MAELRPAESIGRDFYAFGISYHKRELANDYSRAFRCFRAALKYESWESAYYFGEIYYNGKREAQNYAAAYNFYLICAGKGHAELHVQIGERCAFGQGTEVNFEIGIQNYKLASESGSMSGSYLFGHHLLHGTAIGPVPKRGFKLLDQESNGGELRANNDLAQCYEYGIEVDLNCRKRREMRASSGQREI